MVLLHGSSVALATGPADPGQLGTEICVLGFIKEFRFLVPPLPGTIIGTLQTLAAQPLPMIQTRPGFPAVIGAVPDITGLDGRPAVVCGEAVLIAGQPALDVRFALPLRLDTP